MTLPPEPQSAGRGRAFARQYLLDTQPGATADHIDSVVLVVSELVTNAVRYGTEPGDSLRLILDVTQARTVVEVHDPVRRRPRPRPESATRNRGRGLAILDQLCPRLWGAWDRPMGKAVWAAVLTVPEKQLPGERLGVHSYLCETCRSKRHCADGEFLAHAAARAGR
ncbi:ATP-binding protein [Streptomyces sp. NPDC002640]